MVDRHMLGLPGGLLPEVEDVGDIHPPNEIAMMRLVGDAVRKVLSTIYTYYTRQPTRGYHGDDPGISWG